MINKIGIIDYGCGNLASLTNSIKKINSDILVSNKIDELNSCNKLILPGVGAFPYAIGILRKLKLDIFLKEKAKLNLPILGICLGMQLLFERSDEFGGAEGIGILKGAVEKLPNDFPNIPNIGWWDLEIDQSGNKYGLTKDDTFYFVHSFYCKPENVEKKLNIAIDNIDVCAMIEHKSITATQFHPEKSQKSGEKILKNFVNN